MASDEERRNEAVIRDFIAAWSRLDPNELIGYFTEDGVYHNMPGPPVEGRDNVLSLITNFSKPWTETEWDIISIAARDNRVYAERLDRTKAGEKAVDLPCLGVFEMEDGKIKVWRDYFDLATYRNAMS